MTCFGLILLSFIFIILQNFLQFIIGCLICTVRPYSLLNQVIKVYVLSIVYGNMQFTCQNVVNKTWTNCSVVIRMPRIYMDKKVRFHVPDSRIFFLWIFGIIWSSCHDNFPQLIGYKIYLRMQLHYVTQLEIFWTDSHFV